jgi:diguanylate cyclase (GGDEF)-like protein
VARIEFRYAAMSYVAPEAVRYRYRIEGFDDDWIDAGTARVAAYTNLPAGDYAFRVVAANNDGVWNLEGATVRFQIAPSGWETWWFRTLAGLGLLVLLGAIYHLRIWRLHERERALTREIAVHTEALRAANVELRRVAELDGLTQIANRGAFDRRLRQAWAAHADMQYPLAVLLCDIDAFKAYNDSYGHLAGDRALADVARALECVLRMDGDVAARYGGEEFAILLVRCDLDEAEAAGRRILEAVRGLRIEHRASDVSSVVTVSLGITAVVPDAAASPDDAVQSADEALYRAKAEGRDQVALAPHAP